MLTVHNVKAQKYELRNSMDPQIVVSLVFTFEDFNLANQRNNPEGKYP
jgi:hypothetical protein